jgi:hypothetical protein
MDQKEALSAFAMVSVLAPVSGVISGGIFTSLIGGYNTKLSKDVLKVYIWA